MKKGGKKKGSLFSRAASSASRRRLSFHLLVRGTVADALRGRVLVDRVALIRAREPGVEVGLTSDTCRSIVRILVVLKAPVAPALSLASTKVRRRTGRRVEVKLRPLQTSPERSRLECLTQRRMGPGLGRLRRGF
ncbi:hypothetical protein IE53DRAFT_161833 [Violaceomyces palustris]|uniref:Uncharacterized protein n=1 Tax=Violaceomyces palustris TaxID=1673888 RepID=A0ACD0NTG3_9BASI|nr:hypothetical protein IE53DRAFT_161833 [Violaceomyces palustris]